MSGTFSTSCLALQHVDEETHTHTFLYKSAIFFRLVLGTFGRMPIIPWQFRALCCQMAITRRLTPFAWRTDLSRRRVHLFTKEIQWETTAPRPNNGAPPTLETNSRCCAPRRLHPRTTPHARQALTCQAMHMVWIVDRFILDSFSPTARDISLPKDGFLGRGCVCWRLKSCKLMCCYRWNTTDFFVAWKPAPVKKNWCWLLKYDSIFSTCTEELTTSDPKVSRLEELATLRLEQ